MKKLLIFNHKMDLLYDDLYYYIERTNNIETDNDIVICPSSIYLEAFLNNSEWSVGTQNFHYATDKNHTGEISTDQLKSLGVEYAIIGNYERVSEFNENKTIINEKLIAALDSNIFPILCFGENLDEDYQEVLPKLLDSYLKNINNIEFIIFTYEPIYAIGTGTFPKPEKIKEVTTFISNYLENKYHKKPTLLYGGSVDSSNVHDIINVDSINGVLIGNVSANINEVERIIDNI